MPIIYHKNAKTNIYIRTEIRNSNETAAALAAKYGLNINTVLKWKRRKNVMDKSCRPNKLRNILSAADEKKILLCRKKNKPGIDKISVLLKNEIPYINRYLVYRCLVKNGLI